MMINDLLRLARLHIVVGYTLIGMPLAAAIITVTPATLATALAAVNAGDTLKLVGTFDTVKLSNRTFASLVTIDASRAIFTNRFILNNVDNLTVTNGTFNIVGAAAYSQAVTVYGGSNVTFYGSTVIGSAGGEGIVFNSTTNATVSHSNFTGLQVGVVFGSVTNGYITRNTVSGAASDGFDIADSHGVTAAYNSCSAGNPGVGVHPDCIQLWSITGKPFQSNNIVRNNTATGPTQGFTSFASMGGALRIQITGNTVDGSQAQGVACYSCIDSNISYNTTSTLPGSLYLTNINVIGGTNNSVVGNVINPYTRVVVPDGGSLGDLSLVDPLAAFGPPNLTTLLAGAGDYALFVPAGGGVGAVPEPSSWALLLTGFAAIGMVHRGGRARA